MTTEYKYQYVLRCPCGTALTGATEDEIVEVSFVHLREQHPDMADEYEREHILFMAVKLRVQGGSFVRKLTTGVDADGRSCMVEVVDITPAAVGGHGVNVARIHSTSESPPPPRLPATGRHVDVSLAPGLVRWLVVEHPPYDPSAGTATAGTIHHGDTLDLVFVHEGRGAMVLQDGAHEVGAGDLVVLPGVDHAMRAGPEGCRILVVSIGTPPPKVES